MILQSLYEYYERKSKLGEIAPIGFEWKELPFIIVIDEEGNLKELKDTREKEGKKLIPKKFLIPQSVGRSGSASWKITNFLWDHYGYVLGYPKGDASKDRNKRQKLLEDISDKDEYLSELYKSNRFLNYLNLEEVDKLVAYLTENELKNSSKLLSELKKLKKALIDGDKQLSTFKQALEELPENLKSEVGLKAISQFYSKEEYKKVKDLENWGECSKINGANLSFQLYGTTSLILSSGTLMDYKKKQALIPSSEDDKKALCLITGKKDFIERIHQATPIRGGQATGKLVGFQKSSGFDSYGKEQAYNAPIGRYAQIAYTTAINTLIKSESNCLYLGDTAVLFWAEKENQLEQNFSSFFKKSKDNPDADISAIKQLYESIYSGKLTAETDTQFYILGLAPNSARISIRYWLTGTVSEFAKHLKQHFDDLEIVRDKESPEFFALGSMLSHTVLDYKLENIAPNLAGQVTEAVLNGTSYPQTLLHATIRRIRAEQSVTRTRAAIIKACINRFNRFYYNNNKEVITVSLDKTNSNPAYLLGRLFAVLEKVQYKALKIETIRERYYGAFSTAPVTVYPQLMKLKNHHLAKLESGKKFFENLIGEIIDGLDGSGIIPRQFSLDEQGRFAVGYYHQRQDLKFKDNKTESNINTEEN